MKSKLIEISKWLKNDGTDFGNGNNYVNNCKEKLFRKSSGTEFLEMISKRTNELVLEIPGWNKETRFRNTFSE